MGKEQKPEKLVYRLDEVSRIAKLDPKAIESWEKEFYFLHAGETAAGERIFRQRDLAIILRLKELLENQDVTLAGAKKKIEREFAIKGSTAIHSDRLKKLLIQIREQLKDMADSLESK